MAAGAIARGLMNGSVQSSGYGVPSGLLRGHPGLGHHALFGSNGGSIGIGTPACAENEKGPREGAFGWSRGREARGCTADGRVSGVGLLGGARAKKPGAVSRPGTVREFQFHE
jgi:hypothetical protein